MNGSQVSSKLEVYWTTKQIAERTQSSPDAVEKWYNKGLRRTKCGGKTLVSETDFQAFLKSSTEKRAAE